MIEPQLRAFAAFARTLSYTKAAEELCISQPVVSRHVAELSAKLRLPLVRRVGRSNELTPAGEYLATHVLQAEALLDHALRNVRGFASGEEGHLSLVASSTPGTYLLPRPIGEFCRRWPRAGIELAILTAAEAEQAVRAHRFDIGIVGAFEPVPDLESEVLLQDELVFIGPPAMQGAKLSIQDLEELTWINREEGTTTRLLVERLWRELGISPQRRIELPSREALKVAVAQGVGIGACTRFALDVELRAGTVTILAVPVPKLTRKIFLIKPRGSPLTPVAQRFLEILRAEWARLGLDPPADSGRSFPV
jgi:DNA-binding transcriptional LysR family regulator